MSEILSRGGRESGIKSVKDLPIKQDGPPPGGFPSIRYGRRLPNTGPTGLALFTAIGLGMTYGFYRVITGNQRRRAEEEERVAARTAVLPLLQAEEDRKYVEAKRRQVQVEDRLMKGVPGWESGKQDTYSTGRWKPPYSDPARFLLKA
mmetsp:Transcript_9490/g.34803  ORF Transcript_9490/g.34803 Transcript_9490/m.34803 type:complete len:148 (-) Transcript_9490:212-655(-)